MIRLDIDTYNEQSKSRSELEYIRDFIILHYKVQQISDDSEFWRYCQRYESAQKRLQAIRWTCIAANGRILSS